MTTSATVESRAGRPVAVTADAQALNASVMFRDEYDTLVGFWRPDVERHTQTPAFVVACHGCKVAGPAPHMTPNGLVAGKARTAKLAQLAVEYGLGVVALGLERRGGYLTEWNGSCNDQFLVVRECAPLPGDKGRRWQAEMNCAAVGRGRTWYEAARLLAAEVFP